MRGGPDQLAEQRVLGRAARVLRVRGGFSQEALGARAGLHHNQIGRLERGEANVSFVLLVKLMRGLGVPLSHLVREYERLRDPDA